MLKFPKKTEITAKSVSEAKELLLKQTGLTEDEVTFSVVDEGSKGFLGLGSKDAVVTMEVDDPVTSSAVKFLNELFKNMGLVVKVDASLLEDTLNINLIGDDLGVVIGKRGDTLDSIQYLTSLVVNTYTDDYIKVTIDAENYRQKRYDSLIALSNRLADKVAKSGRKYTLEPMNPYERRIIHSNLQANDKVTTFSVGEEPYRKLVIAPKNPRPYSKPRRDTVKKSTIGGYESGYNFDHYLSLDEEDTEE